MARRARHQGVDRDSWRTATAARQPAPLSQGKQGPDTRAAHSDFRGGGRITQFPIRRGQGRIEGQRYWVVISQVGAKIAREPRIQAGACRHLSAGAHTRHRDSDSSRIALPTNDIDGADGERAVVAGKTQFRTAGRLLELSCDRLGVER